MKLTPQVISDAPTYVNAEGQLTLSLRNLHLDSIDNLHLAEDVYSVIDLTNNELVEAGGIPRRESLETLLLANNNISSVGDMAGMSLKSLLLANNNISNLKLLVQLRELGVETLLLAGNPVCTEHHCRQFLVWLLPSLRVLDCEKVKRKERENAQELFGENYENATPAAVALLHGGEDAKPVSKETRNMNSTVSKLTEEERANLVARLKKAQTMEEIEAIQAQLHEGVVGES